MLNFRNVFEVPYNAYKTLVRWYGLVPVVIAFLVIFVCGVVIIYNATTNSLLNSGITELPTTNVVTSTARAYTTGFSGTLIGTAVAKTEATLLTERGGQVISAPVTLGQFVPAGTIIAQFANESESASLTQARGAYASALASAEQSAISITDAKNAVTDSKRALITAHNNAYASVTSIIAGSTDTFFTNPKSSTPGLRINGYNYTSQLNNLRVNLREQLEVWQKNTALLTISSDTTTEMAHARSTIQNSILMVDIFISIFQKERSDSQYTDEEYRSFVSSFTNHRTTLNGLLNSLATAESNVVSATENVERAQLSGGSSSSLASAQITQARGVLQAAEANYNKTIIRTPISGTIATLAVRSGDYASPQSLVAKITNTDGVEITTYISESERVFFRIGDEVIINESATGTVSAISPTIDSNTQKIEMRIAVTDTIIKPGSAVSISIPKTQTAEVQTNESITIPITAIKFTNTAGAIFVVENDILVAKPVTLGTVTGTKVTVLSGIEYDTEFVVDARGKNAGEKVTVTPQ